MKMPPGVGRLSAVDVKNYGPLAVKALLGQRRGAFTALHIAMKPGSKAPALYHAKTQEFFFVLKGSSSGTIAGRRVRFRAGDFAYLPPGTVHQFRAGNGGTEILDIFVPRLDLANPDIIAVDNKPRKRTRKR